MGFEGDMRWICERYEADMLVPKGMTTCAANVTIQGR